MSLKQTKQIRKHERHHQQKVQSADPYVPALQFKALQPTHGCIKHFESNHKCFLNKVIDLNKKCDPVILIKTCYNSEKNANPFRKLTHG